MFSCDDVADVALRASSFACFACVLKEEDPDEVVSWRRQGISPLLQFASVKVGADRNDSGDPVVMPRYFIFFAAAWPKLQKVCTVFQQLQLCVLNISQCFKCFKLKLHMSMLSSRHAPPRAGHASVRLFTSFGAWWMWP